MDRKGQLSKKQRLEDEISQNKIKLGRLLSQKHDYEMKLEQDVEHLCAIIATTYSNEEIAYIENRKKQYEIKCLTQKAICEQTELESEHRIQILKALSDNRFDDMAQVHVSNSEDNNSGQLSTEEMLFSIEMVEDGVEIVEYNGIVDTGTLKIPNMINGKPVVSIGRWFGDKLGFNTIQIPNTVKCLKHCAFRKCEQLLNISLPVDLEYMEPNSFAYCKNLKKIVVPEKIKEIPCGCFKSCRNLTHVTLNNGLERICAEAFINTSITSVIFPESIKKIEEKAFYNKDNENHRMSVAFLGLDDVEIEPESIPMTATIYCWPKSKVWKTALNMGYTTKPLTEFAIHE